MIYVSMSICYDICMKTWIPIPGTNKEKILKVALEEFSSRGFNGVNITELAQKADMTTGAIYHHFGSKSNLYEIIRAEMEQRIIDRMEGAASLFDQPKEKLEAALITGLDFVLKLNISRLFSEVTQNAQTDKIENFLEEINQNKIIGLELILSSSWRSILHSITENKLTAAQGKDLIKWLFMSKFN
jgi:AcrR family transcriptional regulator